MTHARRVLKAFSNAYEYRKKTRGFLLRSELSACPKIFHMMHPDFAGLPLKVRSDSDPVRLHPGDVKAHGIRFELRRE